MQRAVKEEDEQVVQQAEPTDVVITGVAALTPIGLGYEAMKRGLRRCEPRLGQVTLFDDAVASGVCAGELADFDAEAIVGKRGLRNKARTSLLAIGCLQVDFAKTIAAIGPEHVGLTVGTAFGCYSKQAQFSVTYQREGYRAIGAADFPNMVINAPASQANIWFGMLESSSTLANDGASGIDAIGYSAHQIAVGRSSCLIAGGVESLVLHLALAYQRAGLSPAGNRVRPFDAQRDGALLGEGAAFVMLESRADAERRGAPIMAQVLGYAATFDGGLGYRKQPDAEGAARAMRLALEQAGITADEVDVIAASASGSVEGDASEARAIREVFGAKAATVPVVAYKSYWGECLGASGAMQVAAALADLEDDIVSATCGFTRSEAGLNVTSEPIAQAGARIVMVNAFADTGNNASLVLRKAA